MYSAYAKSTSVEIWRQCNDLHKWMVRSGYLSRKKHRSSWVMMRSGLVLSNILDMDFSPSRMERQRVSGPPNWETDHLLIIRVDKCCSSQVATRLRGNYLLGSVLNTIPINSTSPSRQELIEENFCKAMTWIRSFHTVSFE